MNGYEDLSLLELIFDFIIRGLALTWLLYLTIRYYQHTKSPMYEKVLKNSLEVGLSQLDLKYEYKTAILKFKQEKLRDKATPKSSPYYHQTSMLELFHRYKKMNGRLKFEEFIHWLPKLDFTKIESMPMDKIRPTNSLAGESRED